MKVVSLELREFLAHARFHAVMGDAPVVVFCGDNGSGKTSALQGLRLCLTGADQRGATTKAALRELIRDGAKPGASTIAVAVESAGQSTTMLTYAVAKGAWDHGITPANADNAYSLEPERFLALNAADRQRAMLQLAGVKVTGQQIIEELGRRGHANERVTKLDWRAGMDACATEAKSEASRCRARWEVLTEERYGSKKAEDWRPFQQQDSGPDVDQDAKIAELRGAVSELQAAITLAQQNIAEAERIDTMHANLEASAAKMNLPPRLQVQAELDQVEADMRRASSALGAAKSQAQMAGDTMECPCCRSRLKLVEDTLIEVKPGAVSVGKAAADAALAKAQADAAALERKVASLKSALQSIDTLDLQKRNLPARPDAQALNVQRIELDRLRLGLDVQKASLAGAITAKAEAERVQTLAEKALAEHRGVQAWTALAEDIANLPGFFVAQATTRINGYMAQMTEVFGTTVQLTNDAEVMWGSHPYALASESQQVRCELALAFAFAKCTGLGVVVVDRFDAIVAHRRAPLLKWMATARTGVQWILGCTLKERPKDHPAINFIWLEGGA